MLFQTAFDLSYEYWWISGCYSYIFGSVAELAQVVPVILLIHNLIVLLRIQCYLKKCTNRAYDSVDAHQLLPTCDCKEISTLENKRFIFLHCWNTFGPTWVQNSQWHRSTIHFKVTNPAVTEQEMTSMCAGALHNPAVSKLLHLRTCGYP